MLRVVVRLPLRVTSDCHIEESRLYITVIRPTKESWATGNRGFNCLITNEDESLARTGSVKGSRL